MPASLADDQISDRRVPVTDWGRTKRDYLDQDRLSVGQETAAVSDKEETPGAAKEGISSGQGRIKVVLRNLHCRPHTPLRLGLRLVLSRGHHPRGQSRV